MTHYLFRLSIIFSGIILLISPHFAYLASQTIALDPPGQGEYVIDLAGMLDTSDISFINKTSSQLSADHNIPIIVVTIRSMKRHAKEKMTIDEFAFVLYNQWRIGYFELDGKPWNKGILLLVSQDDRKARIELGGGYDTSLNPQCNMIMQNKIIYYFKSLRFPAGIRSGVTALDEMAREAEGEENGPWYLNPWFIGGTILFIVIIAWLLATGRRGSFFMTRLAVYSGIGWFIYTRTNKEGLALTILGAGLMEIVTGLSALGFLGGGGSVRIRGNSYYHNSYSDGYFGGGFSGGGFSGGGGATGSW